MRLRWQRRPPANGWLERRPSKRAHDARRGGDGSFALLYLGIATAISLDAHDSGGTDLTIVPRAVTTTWRGLGIQGFADD